MMVAVVAVLLIHIERIPVMSMRPSSTKEGFLPNGRNMMAARFLSTPYFAAPKARKNPPRNRIRTRLARVLKKSVYFGGPFSRG